MAHSSSASFTGSISEASTSMAGSMRSPLSSFMRSPSSMMPSPVSSRLTTEFKTAFLMEAEEPVRFTSTDILPYLSQPSSRSVSSSDFDTLSEVSRSTSFCDFNDSNRITLGSLIGLPMDSFQHFGESFRFRIRGDSRDFDSSARTAEGSPRRSRTCNLLAGLFRCLQRARTEYVTNATVPVGRNLTNLTSFTITEVSEEERDSDSDLGPTVFDNSVFVERDTLGSRIYEFNPLYIADVMSEVDLTESRDVSLAREHPQPRPPAASVAEPNKVSAKRIDNPRDSDDVETPRVSVKVTSQASPICRSQPLSPMRAMLTTVCCQLGDDSDEYLSDCG